MSISASTKNIIINSISFYTSRHYSEEEMIHDIAETLRIPQNEVREVVKTIKKQNK